MNRYLYFVKKAELHITGLIGSKDAVSDKLLKELGVNTRYGISDFRKDLALINFAEIEELEVTINTFGGSVTEGLAMYDTLMEVQRSTKVATVGERMDSIGSIIFLAGNERKALSGSQPLIHAPWMKAEDLGPDTVINTTTIEQLAEFYRQSDGQMLAIYAERCGREKTQLFAELMRAETKLTDEQMIDLNFATEIIKQQASASKIRAVAYDVKALGLTVKGQKQYADAVAVKDGKFLVIQRTADDDLEANKYAFAGGKIEEGESPEQAALRELKEETGYEAEAIEMLSEVDHDETHKTFYLLAEITGGAEELAPDEVQSAKFVSLEELEGLDIIFGQTDLYKSLIQKSQAIMSTSEKIEAKLTGLESVLSKVAKVLGMDKPEPKAATFKVVEGPELFVDIPEGETAEGKVAYIIQEGVVTEQVAPDGEHTLESGEIVVVSEGVITEVRQASAVSDDEMAKMMEEKKELEARLSAAEKALATQKSEFTKVLKEANEAANSLKSEFAALKATAAPKAPAAPEKPAKELTSYERLKLRAQSNFQSN